MGIASKEFLFSAEELLSKDNAKEIDFRNAISRAYYCAFHQVQDYVEHAPDGHRPLIKHLKNKHNQETKLSYDQYFEAAVLLDQLRTLREVADYCINDTVYDIPAKTSVRTVKDLIALIEG